MVCCAVEFCSKTPTGIGGSTAIISKQDSVFVVRPALYKPEIQFEEEFYELIYNRYVSDNVGFAAM